MSRPVFVLDEILAILKSSGAPQRTIDVFRQHAETIAGKRNEREAETTTPEEPTADRVIVSSSFGHRTERAYVEFTLNDQRTQMEPKKAREIGLMLLEAAEAAASDEIFVTLLARLGLTSVEARGRALLDLREIRQGTRDVSWPS